MKKNKYLFFKQFLKYNIYINKYLRFFYLKNKVSINLFRNNINTYIPKNNIYYILKYNNFMHFIEKKRKKN